MGVTISAVIVFLGCAATLLVAASMLFAFWFLPMPQPQFMKLAIPISGMFFLGFAAWGISSGVGLLRLREWARISLLVFSALLLLISLPGLLVLLVLPFPTPPNLQDPELARQSMLFVRALVAVFYGLLAALAIFWLIFFNTRSVRGKFCGVLPAAPDAPRARRRPISITIIGWYLLISGCFFPFLFFFHFPILIFGFLLRGPTATLIIVALCLLQTVIGVGLLKLQPWARVTAICYSLYLPLNSLAAFLIPGSRARFEQVQDEVQKMFGTTSQAYNAFPHSARFSMWLSLVYTLPLAGVLLWFLFKTKSSFEPSAPPGAPLT